VSGEKINLDVTLKGYQRNGVLFMTKSDYSVPEIRAFHVRKRIPLEMFNLSFILGRSFYTTRTTSLMTSFEEAQENFARISHLVETLREKDEGLILTASFSDSDLESQFILLPDQTNGSNHALISEICSLNHLIFPANEPTPSVPLAIVDEIHDVMSQIEMASHYKPKRGNQHSHFEELVASSFIPPKVTEKRENAENLENQKSDSKSILKKGASKDQSRKNVSRLKRSKRSTRDD